jgi:large subunit ribosomal protein L4
MNQSGKKIKDIDVLNDLFEGSINKSVLHECVKKYLAAQRQGTACTKTRGQIAGSGAKPWKQKGTGRARSGTKKSPIWRSGGTVFGPQPRSYVYTIPKKVRRLALLSILRSRYQSKQCVILDSLAFAVPKTKDMLGMFKDIKVSENVLLVLSTSLNENKENICKSASNLKRVTVRDSLIVNALDVIQREYIVFTEGALVEIEKRLLSVSIPSEGVSS